ncbi:MULTISPECIES: carbohydrate ABC transporter permease [Streptomycetaceae]|uniref:Cellobiose ABC transporter permease protein n=1 Tax=Streptantibioticus cattleyicolor (strain ATCC 35852 / DSM 46488 / JCM 4925 / NBRC 14057 / NRRL 8057) TaxID=1003195 RepID=F8K1W7_STREN|nr:MULTISPECIES: carbohydrate ABC transporter permease [Streptomycetaceae]AEW92442.1 cellobiose ABC transporter permease protein [Streptantibioticus cattleyicolor NRRL 8057 = DSM 46488]MYS57249.1 ABC transporter permease subunit [Streptomyces sp. SID5468]CCB72806.1 Cellobiose transport permease [Streptantibioticus cattleyicolor NRRL 8057 = DSM 46488]
MTSLRLGVRAGRQRHGGPLAYLVLTVVAVASLFPLYFAVVAASTSQSRIAQSPPPLVPGGNLLRNLRAVWNYNGPGAHSLGLALVNSVIVAGAVTAATVLFATFAGFAFAKLRFTGRNVLLTLVVATIAVPPQLSVLPLFQLISGLHWTDHLQAVILPGLVTAFGVFFMRQYLSEALPTELLEAARTDGANSLRIVWHVVFPAARPAMAVLGMLTFVQAWNDFLWPLIALTPTGNPTLQVALAGIGGGYNINEAVIMAGAVIATVPLLVAFALFGKQIVGGVMQGAVKG